MTTTRRSLLLVIAAITLFGIRPSSALASKTESPMSGNVSGVVTLDGTEPLIGARITLIPAGSVNRKQTTRRTVSAEGGKFNIGVPAGKYVLRVFKEDVGQ